MPRSVAHSGIDRWVSPAPDRQRIRKIDRTAPIGSKAYRLDLAEPAAPVCLLKTAGALIRDCRAAAMVMELNPAYFDKSRPEAVPLLVVETPPSAGHGETADRFVELKAV